MDRLLTAIAAALEAAGIAVGGIVVVLVPSILTWFIHGQLTGDPWGVWAFVASAWLLAHGVPIGLQLDGQTAAGLGLSGGPLELSLSLAPLALTGLTVLLAAGTGRRAAQSDAPLTGLVAAFLAFGVVGAGVGWSLSATSVHVPLALCGLAPAAVYALGLVAGALSLPPARRSDGAQRMLEGPAAALRRAPDWLRAGLAGGTRAGLAALAGFFALAAALLAVALAARYADVVGGYESLHPDPFGAFVLTLGQAAYLPDAVAWTGAWLLGPGFALGSGTIVSPWETAVGPAPAIPLLSAIPLDLGPLAAAGIALPVLAGFVAGHLAGLSRVPVRAEGWLAGRAVAVLLGAAIAAGGAALAALVSSGSAGPDRLAAVGPDPLPVLAFGALLLGGGILLGAASATLLARRRQQLQVPEREGEPVL